MICYDGGIFVGNAPHILYLKDTNGDGVADKYETLFDAHSFHGNYHTYMHGPVRGPDGSYYIALNLAHDASRTTYNAGGEFMGTWGGFSGWAIRVRANGKSELFANGLRSPASLGVDRVGLGGEGRGQVDQAHRRVDLAPARHAGARKGLHRILPLFVIGNDGEARSGEIGRSKRRDGIGRFQWRMQSSEGRQRQWA